MKFIRIKSDNTDSIYPIGFSDVITLENKNNNYSGSKLILNKKDFIVELNDSTDGHSDDIYEEICKWLSTGVAYGEETDLFVIDKGPIDNYIISRYEER